MELRRGHQMVRGPSKKFPVVNTGILNIFTGLLLYVVNTEILTIVDNFWQLKAL